MSNTCMCCSSKFNFLNPQITIAGTNNSLFQLCSDCNKHLDLLMQYSNLKLQQLYEKELEYFNSKIKDLDGEFSKYIEEISTTIEREFAENISREIKGLQLQEEKNKEYAAKAASLIITNGFNIEGYVITKYIAVLSSEAVLGTGFFSEIDASFSDVFGSESNTFNTKIDDARKSATKRLTHKAIVLGATAIIGLEYSYMTVKNNMMAVMVTGTAVNIAGVAGDMTTK